MAWRVARSLLTLRDQLDAAYPDRSRASDGTIGDAAHQVQVSDHNPDGGGVVRALDVTHDPAHGVDIDALSDELIGSRDPRISYVIANRLISGPNYGWTWAEYDGDDPHTNHLHLSVVGDDRADDPRPWQIGTGAAGGDSMDWRDKDPYGAGPDGGVREVAAEIRDGYYAMLQGARPSGTTAAGVIPRLERIEAAVGHPAAPALTQEQLTQIGAAAATEAATILGERLEVVEEQLAQVIAALRAGATAEAGALGTAQP